MDISELNKLYDDICHKLVDAKFLNQEIYDLTTRMFEELYTLKFKDNIKNCEHKNTSVCNGLVGCLDCGKIL